MKSVVINADILHLLGALLFFCISSTSCNQEPDSVVLTKKALEKSRPESRTSQPPLGSDNVVKKTFEKDRDNDGLPDLRTETHARGKTKVFTQMQRRLPSGLWSVARSYFASGEVFAMEEDTDGDGFFETLIVFNPSADDLEVFLRQKDGSILIASDDAKAAYQKIFRAMDELWEEDPGGVKDEISGDRISGAAGKIQSAVRELENSSRR